MVFLQQSLGRQGLIADGQDTRPHSSNRTDDLGTFCSAASRELFHRLPVAFVGRHAHRLGHQQSHQLDVDGDRLPGGCRSPAPTPRWPRCTCRSSGTPRPARRGQPRSPDRWRWPGGRHPSPCPGCSTGGSNSRSNNRPAFADPAGRPTRGGPSPTPFGQRPTPFCRTTSAASRNSITTGLTVCRLEAQQFVDHSAGFIELPHVEAHHRPLLDNLRLVLGRFAPFPQLRQRLIVLADTQTDVGQGQIDRRIGLVGLLADFHDLAGYVGVPGRQLALGGQRNRLAIFRRQLPRLRGFLGGLGHIANVLIQVFSVQDVQLWPNWGFA